MTGKSLTICQLISDERLDFLEKCSILTNQMLMKHLMVFHHFKKKKLNLIKEHHDNQKNQVGDCHFSSSQKSRKTYLNF